MNLTLLPPSPDFLPVHFFLKSRGREQDTTSGFDVRFETKFFPKTRSCISSFGENKFMFGFEKNEGHRARISPKPGHVSTQDFTVVRIDQSSVCVIDFELQVDMQESKTNKGMEEMDVYHTSKKEEKPRTKIVVCLPIFCGRVVYGLLFF